LAEVGTDCISRQAAFDICDHAIDLLKGQFGAGALDAIRESIAELPSAEPEKRTEERTETHGVCLDAISRQAAIDAVYKNDHRTTIKQRLDALPSAQPKIIVCEDCKWRISENSKTTSLWLPCRALVTPDKFSCIYAERGEVTE
jgi:hypothetical protein